MIELEPIIGLSERSIRESLKSLEEKGLIKLIQSGHRKAIYINPSYYATGKDLDSDTLQMFSLIKCDDEKVNEYLINE
jgi:DNA-binding transcriptional ArsR family regulator